MKFDFDRVDKHANAKVVHKTNFNQPGTVHKTWWMAN